MATASEWRRYNKGRTQHPIHAWMISAFNRRHPYIVAERLYLRGHIPSCQAIAMVASDREFRAEATLAMEDVLVAARRVVLESWRAKLVASSVGRAA